MECTLPFASPTYNSVTIQYVQVPTFYQNSFCCELLLQVKKICDFPSHEFYHNELETPQETRNVYERQLEVLWPKKGMCHTI